MSELEGHRGPLSPQDGLARLAELWGPADEDSREQRMADAWARRALDLGAHEGDDLLLTLVDADLAAKYGLHRQAS